MAIQFFLPLPKRKWPKKLKEYGLWIFQYLENYSSPPHIKNDVFRAYSFYTISHLLEGKGWYCDNNGNSSLMKKGDCVCVVANEKHGYGGLGTEYVEDFISFTGPLADSWVASGILKSGVMHLGNFRELLFIIEAARIPTVDSQFQANLKLTNLIHKLYFQHNIKSPDYSSLQRVRAIINEINQNPKHWWRVKEMASAADLSISQFRRIFQSDTGLKPKQYIIELKIKSIAEELNKKNCRLAEISSNYGFQDFSHFSRLFKSQIGCSPSVYSSLISQRL